MPIPQVPAPAGPRPLLGQRVYEQLVDAIVRGELAPGTVLVDADLTARLGTSRTPVREAINRLAALGLVDVQPNRSTRVAPLDDLRTYDSFRVIGELGRLAIERSVPRLTDEDRATLVEYRDRTLADAGSYRASLAEGGYQHRLFAVFTVRYGNRVLRQVLAQATPTVRRYVAAHRDELDVAAGLQGQRDLVAKALAGDAAGAAAALRPWLVSTLPSALVERGRLPRPAPSSGSARSRQLVSDVAADTIRAAVVDGTLVAGEVLLESDLIAWLSASRTPIRVALNALALEGLVELEPNQHARVASWDRADDIDTLEVARAMHGLTAELFAPQVTVDEVTRMASELQVATTMAEHDDWRAVAASVVRYTAIFDRSSRNTVLVEVTDRLRARMERFLYVTDERETIHRSLAAFGALQAAVEARDTDGARAAVAALPGGTGRGTTAPDPGRV